MGVRGARQVGLVVGGEVGDLSILVEGDGPEVGFFVLLCVGAVVEGAGVHDFECAFLGGGGRFVLSWWGLWGFAEEVADLDGDVAVLVGEFAPPGAAVKVFLGGDFVGEFWC